MLVGTQKKDDFMYENETKTNWTINKFINDTNETITLLLILLLLEVVVFEWLSKMQYTIFSKLYADYKCILKISWRTLCSLSHQTVTSIYEFTTNKKYFWFSITFWRKYSLST